MFITDDRSWPPATRWADTAQPRRRGGSSRAVISATASAPGRTYRIAVHGLRCRVLAMISCRGMPWAQLVESNVPTTLNTSTGAGRLEATPGLVITGMDLPGRGAGPGQEPPPADGCDACRPRPRHGCTAACRVADGRTGGCENVRLRGAGMHEVQRERLVARSGA
jgi:hypothetical protein